MATYEELLEALRAEVRGSERTRDGEVDYALLAARLLRERDAVRAELCLDVARARERDDALRQADALQASLQRAHEETQAARQQGVALAGELARAEGATEEARELAREYYTDLCRSKRGYAGTLRGRYPWIVSGDDQ